MLAAVVEEDVVDNAGIVVAGNAAGQVLEYEQVFHIPSLGYCSSLAVAVEDTHCFAQPKASSAWNMGSPVERNSWQLARAIQEQDFAEEHTPAKIRKHVDIPYLLEKGFVSLYLNRISTWCVGPNMSGR